MKVIKLLIEENNLLTKKEIVLTDFDGQDISLVGITEVFSKVTYVNNKNNIALKDSYRCIGDCNIVTINEDKTETSAYHNMLLNDTSRLLLVTTKELATDFTLEED